MLMANAKHLLTCIVTLESIFFPFVCIRISFNFHLWSLTNLNPPVCCCFLNSLGLVGLKLWSDTCTLSLLYVVLHKITDFSLISHWFLTDFLIIPGFQDPQGCQLQAAVPKSRELPI